MYVALGRAQPTSASTPSAIPFQRASRATALAFTLDLLVARLANVVGVDIDRFWHAAEPREFMGSRTTMDRNQW
jgi:hypothetical protein